MILIYEKKHLNYYCSNYYNKCTINLIIKNSNLKVIYFSICINYKYAWVKMKFYYFSTIITNIRSKVPSVNDTNFDKRYIENYRSEDTGISQGDSQLIYTRVLQIVN